MLHISVSGKVIEKRSMNVPDSKEFPVTFDLSQRQYNYGEGETYYLWTILIPPFLEKASVRLVHEGKYIGVSGHLAWQIPAEYKLKAHHPMLVLVADELFIL